MTAMTLLTPKIMTILLGALAFDALLIAAFFEHVLKLEPCVLCLWQRVPHWIIIALALLTLIAPKKFITPILLLMMLSAIGGMGVALWHVGVETGLFNPPSACGGGVSFGDNPSNILDQLLASPAIPCNEVPWSLFGVSMAGWNAILLFIMSTAALITIINSRKGERYARF